MQVYAFYHICKIISSYFLQYLEYFFNPILFHLFFQDSSNMNIESFVIVQQVPVFQIM